MSVMHEKYQQQEQRAGPVLAPDRSRRSFDAEFKADAVALVLEEG